MLLEVDIKKKSFGFPNDFFYAMWFCNELSEKKGEGVCNKYFSFAFLLSSGLHFQSMSLFLLLFLFKSIPTLCLDVEFLTIAGNQGTAEVGTSDMTDNLDIFHGSYLFVHSQRYGEE